jgi:hypothetical protein
MEPKDSLQCSQDLVAALYFKPHKSNPPSDAVMAQTGTEKKKKKSNPQARILFINYIPF